MKTEVVRRAVSDKGTWFRLARYTSGYYIDFQRAGGTWCQLHPQGVDREQALHEWALFIKRDRLSEAAHG